MSLSPELYETIVKIIEEKVREIKVKREEFDKLTSETTKIAENLKKLAQRVDELAVAQRKTEERLARLTERVDKLTERVDKLAQRVDELAVAQRKTEEAVAKLTIQMGNLSVNVGKLSDVIGFGLEDVARVVVPGWLERHEKIYVEDLTRKFFEVDGELIEVNLYGEGLKGEKTIYVLGETKSRIHGKDVKDFSSKLVKLNKLFQDKETYKLMFGFLIYPAAEKEAGKHGIKTIASYMR